MVFLAVVVKYGSFLKADAAAQGPSSSRGPLQQHCLEIRIALSFLTPRCDSSQLWIFVQALITRRRERKAIVSSFFTRLRGRFNLCATAFGTKGVFPPRP